jgi:hypothetical protein
MHEAVMTRVTTSSLVLALTLLAACGTKDAPANDASRGKADAATAGGVGIPPVVGTPRGPQGVETPPAPPNGDNAPPGDRNSGVGTIVGTDEAKAVDAKAADGSTKQEKHTP